MSSKKKAIIFYILATLFLIYAGWQVVLICKEITEYYAQFDGASAKVSEYIKYSLQSGLQPVAWSLTMLGFGWLLNPKKECICSEKIEEKIEKKEEQNKESLSEEETPATNYVSMTKAELYKLAKEKGLDVSRKTTKKELINILG